MRFPLPYVPSVSYRYGNGFGASRESVRPGLRHAANDLRAPPGTPVLAMERGTVIADVAPFFRGTFQLAIRHPSFIARYCEIGEDVEVAEGDEVLEGQVIGYVGDQPGRDMLHIEFFTGARGGSFSTRPGASPPYDRRADIFDGTRFLDGSRNTATHFEGVDNWRFDRDAQGRLFLAEMSLLDI